MKPTYNIADPLFTAVDITAIESILTPAAADTTAIYDLSGRRVEAVTHGLYIQNGKIRLANKKYK